MTARFLAYGPYKPILDALSDPVGFPDVPPGHPIVVEITRASTRGVAEALAGAFGLDPWSRAAWTRPVEILPFLEQALEGILPHDAEQIARDLDLLAQAGGFTLVYLPG